MNNLVSKNPVLRFKLGRKIVKAKWGDAVPYPLPLNDENGDPYVGMWYSNEDNKPVGTALIYNTELIRLRDSENPFYDSAYFVNTPYYQILSNNKYRGPRDFVNSYEKTGGHPTIDKKALPKRNSSKTNNIFIKGFQNRKGEIKDVRAMLKKLMELGLLKDRFGADGKWGKNTEAAYLKYLTIKNIPEYTPFEHISPAELMGIPTSEENTPLYQRIRFKQGGLISKNPIKRFKQNVKIVKALQGKALPTAPSVKERYSGGYRYLIPWMKKVRGPKTSMLVHPGEILLYVREVTPYYNDTTYVEVPEHTSFVDIKPRVASTNSTEDLNSPILDKNGWPTGHYKFKFNNSPEYEILKRRFNTAWNLAK